ncbi:MAG: hypothetical protein IT486_02795 [Gammaproteobacteria bacterium]|nr:hypothetical protein [Gammaproteobacteria bacterium]
MKPAIACAAGALLLATNVAGAEVSATVTATTDYDFRGMSQTEGDPALQASLDWAGDLFYIGTWASNVDFGDEVDGNLEVDLYGGFAGETGAGLRWDIGATAYLYPGSDDNLAKSKIGEYMEAFAGIGYGPVDLKYWYSPDLYNIGETASYVEANAAFDLPWWELGLNLHGGYSFGDAWDTFEDEARAEDPEYTGDDATYYDWSVGLARSFGRFDVELKYVDTITDGSYWDIDSGANRNDERVILSIATTFPWSDDEEGE